MHQQVGARSSAASTGIKSASGFSAGTFAGTWLWWGMTALARCQDTVAQ